MAPGRQVRRPADLLRQQAGPHRASFDLLRQDDQRALNAIAAVQLPIGAEADFTGVVDLVEMRPDLGGERTIGEDYEVEEIPADSRPTPEAPAPSSSRRSPRPTPELMERSTGGEEITVDEIKGAIRKLTIPRDHRGDVRHPFKNKGVQPMLDAVIDYLPTPLDVAGHRRLQPGRDGTGRIDRASRATTTSR